MRVIVFDVNETLLDLSALAPQFERLFSDTGALDAWFNRLLQNALLATVLNDYRDFGELAIAALDSLAIERGVALTNSHRETVFDTLRQLPAHADVKPALSMLKDAGFRLAALTNSPYRVLEHQLDNAGIRQYFDQVLSVDEVRRFKPHAAVYAMAADKLGVTPADIRMVAAHAWDTTGAQAAGCQAAFVARPGKFLGKLDIKPGIEAPTLTEVARKIIELDSP